MCAQREGLSQPDGKFNLEISTANGRKVFHCWKCEPKFAGSLDRLIKKYGSASDYELYKSYKGLTDFEDDEDKEYEEAEYARIGLPKETILFSDIDLKNPEHFEAYNYLITERKLTKKTILRYRLGFCIEGKYSKRIIIPSYDVYGEVNYFVSRTYDPRVKKRKYDNPQSDKDALIFNEGFIDWDSPVFLVEGVFDMFSVPNSIPLLGKTISKLLYLRLKEYQPKIIIILDPDAWTNEMNLYDILKLIYDDETNKILVVNLTGEYDVDEIRKFLGEDEVIKRLYGARKLNDMDYFDKKTIKNDFNSKYEKNAYYRYSGTSKF